MNGIENIIKRISEEAEETAAKIIAQAENDAADIKKEYEAKSAEKREEIVSRGEKIASERAARFHGAYELESRKASLSKKQELISLAFDAAAEKLEALSDDERASALANLALRAANGGSGEIILSASERAAIGEKILAKCAANKNITLSEEVRDIGGGFILRDGATEVNCTFRTLVSGLRDEMGRSVADILFG